jgi:hypothetical protein
MTETTEYAIGMAGGSMAVRPNDPESERFYPLADWIANHQTNGGKVFQRTVVIVTDWEEVPR